MSNLTRDLINCVYYKHGRSLNYIRIFFGVSREAVYEAIDNYSRTPKKCD